MLLVFGSGAALRVSKIACTNGKLPQVSQKQVLALQQKCCRGGVLCPDLPSFYLHRQHCIQTQAI